MPDTCKYGRKCSLLYGVRQRKREHGLKWLSEESHIHEPIHIFCSHMHTRTHGSVYGAAVRGLIRRGSIREKPQFCIDPYAGLTSIGAASWRLRSSCHTVSENIGSRKIPRMAYTRMRYTSQSDDKTPRACTLGRNVTAAC